MATSARCAVWRLPETSKTMKARLNRAMKGMPKKKEKLAKRSSGAIAKPDLPVAQRKAPKSVLKDVGRAVILAHGAGGSPNHASMKAWKQIFAPMCDEVLMVEFPKTKNMRDLTAAYATTIANACDAGHQRLVLIGVSMGARAALHLLSGIAADEGEPIERLPAEQGARICGCVALGYPLRRPNSNEMRDAPIRALPAGAPPLLVVCGSEDTHMDMPALQAALGATAARTELHVLGGLDGVTRHPEGTHTQRLATAALDKKLSEFVEGVLGSAAEWSRQVKLKVPRATAKLGAAALAARQLTALEDAQRRNSEEQIRLKKLDRKLSTMAQEADKAAKRAVILEAMQRVAAKADAGGTLDAGGALDAGGGGANADGDGGPAVAISDAISDASAALAAVQSAPGAPEHGNSYPATAPSSAEALHPAVASAPSFLLAGCGSDAINGVYHPEGMRDGVPCYRQEGGANMTIERDSAPGQITQWCLCQDFGYTTFCYVDSDTVLPPTTGWVVSDACEAPPPSLFPLVGSGDHIAAIMALAAQRKNQSKSSRRRKAMQSKYSIPRNGLNRKRLKR